MENEKKVVIPKEKLIQGICLSYDNAKYFLSESKILYNKKSYRISIPCAIISIEEALKGIELADKFFKNEEIEKNNWTNLKKHQFKLQKVNNILNNIKEFKQSDYELISNLLKFEKTKKENIIAYNESFFRFYPYLQLLREWCFYVDWDEEKKEWIEFSKMKNELLADLNYFITIQAEIRVNALKHNIEYIINELRALGLQISSHYISYNINKKILHFDSIIEMHDIFKKIDREKYTSGFSTMNKFMETNRFKF